MQISAKPVPNTCTLRPRADTLQEGVWKVGQRHVDDIENLPDVSRSYNLVTKTEFNTELGLWKEDPRRRAFPNVQDESDHEQQPGKKFLDNSAKLV
jgi:hypothetical protein